MPEPLDTARRTLGERALQALQALGHDDVHFEPEGFRLRLAGGHARLEGLWNHLQQLDAPDVDIAIGQWVARVARIEAPDADPVLARRRLRPRLAPRALHTRLALEGRLLERPYVPQGGALTPALVVDVVYDFPDRRVPISDAALGSWGLTRGVALDLALAQLHQEVRFVERSAGLYTTAPRDGAAAALMLWAHSATLGPLSEATGVAVRGQPVFLPLRDDLLLIAGSDDATALQAMLDSAARIRPQLSGTPLVLGSDGFEAFPVPAILAPLAQRLAHLERVHHHTLAYGDGPPLELLSRVYGLPQGWLRIHGGELLAIPTGWPGLLPEADAVQVGERRMPFSAISAHAERVDGLWPPVWRTGDSPP